MTTPTLTALENASWDWTGMHRDDRIEVDLEPEKPRRSFPTGIVATAVIVVVGLFFFQPTDDIRSADELTAAVTALPDPERFTAVDIATGFVEAYGAFDIDRAASYLAADADLSRLEGGDEGWRLGNSWLQAQGFKLLLNSCNESPPDPVRTFVRCRFHFHGLRSDEIGLRAFAGSWLDFCVEEGGIVYSSMFLRFEEFGPQMWDRFRRWVAENYPTDAAVMYLGAGNPRLTEESIALWEQRSLKYAEFVTASEDGYVLRTTAICTAAHARLNEELQAAGIELEVPGVTDDPLALIATTDDDFAVYDAAARRIMGETLPELRAVPPPVTVQRHFDHLYGLMEQFAKGEEALFTPTPEYWVHAVDLEPSLVHCRFSMPG